MIVFLLPYLCCPTACWWRECQLCTSSLELSPGCWLLAAASCLLTIGLISRGATLLTTLVCSLPPSDPSALLPYSGFAPVVVPAAVPPAVAPPPDLPLPPRTRTSQSSRRQQSRRRKGWLTFFSYFSFPQDDCAPRRLPLPQAL